ncbi:uncharacterized protein LOC143905560 [Temnothorax americanus]|uniref:uncharacterized protein LOC143905560 n=1 Tax=Temnothorax americanus TaxID=1964332 RepID=UPI004068025C
MEFGEPESFTNHDIQQDMFNKIQNFICDIYNVTGTLDVDAARLQLFINIITTPFLMANYISSIWNNANKKQPSIFTPENNGWTLEENQYHHWFDGDQLPGFVSETLQENTEEAASDDNDKDDDDDDLNIEYHDWLDDEVSDDPNDDDQDD